VYYAYQDIIEANQRLKAVLMLSADREQEDYGGSQKLWNSSQGKGRDYIQGKIIDAILTNQNGVLDRVVLTPEGEV
jgi:hypothetical protein